VIGCDLSIGRFALVGMGSVVTRSAPAFHLVVGQPARSVAVVSRVGEPIVRFSGARPPDRDEVVCPVSGLRYAIQAGEVIELDAPS
jgi:UDP-2-acetamido-3-amino-2,3-dideoxy-glucuronate N-acetyltransferase